MESFVTVFLFFPFFFMGGWGACQRGIAPGIAPVATRAQMASRRELAKSMDKVYARCGISRQAGCRGDDDKFQIRSLPAGVVLRKAGGSTRPEQPEVEMGHTASYLILSAGRTRLEKHNPVWP